MDPVWIFVVVALILLIMADLLYLASRYKRCPAGKVLVKYGKLESRKKYQFFHGGGSFIFPLIQHYAYLDLTPITINIGLQDIPAKPILSGKKPSTFIVAVGKEEEFLINAADRLLQVSSSEIESMAREIILTQFKSAIADLKAEKVEAERNDILKDLRNKINRPLKELGFVLINMNV